MKIFIIGGTGFIGPFVVRHLHRMGHEVTVFHRGVTEPDLPTEINHLHHPDRPVGFRDQLTEFRQQIEAMAPEVVLDQSPITDEQTRSVMETFKGIARRVVAVSSVDVYRAYGVARNTEEGDPDPVPLTEKSPLRLNLYPDQPPEPFADDHPQHLMNRYDKILCENEVMKGGDLEGTVIRLPMVYGPGDRQHRLSQYLQPMLRNEEYILIPEGFAEWRGARGYVENMALAVALAVTDDRAAGEIYHVAESTAYSEMEWARRIADSVEWKGQVITVPKELLPAEFDLGFRTDQHWVIDSSKIRNELEYEEAVNLSEALQRSIEWETKHPPEKPLQLFEEDIRAQLLGQLEARGLMELR